MIRQATAADEAAIRDCAERAYARYAPLIGRRPAPMQADYAGQIAAGDVFVAEEEGRFLGFVVFFGEGDHLLLENVAVVPEAAGRGTGRALMQFCETAAAARGFTAVVLYTNAKMTENLSIYPRLGYVETGRRHEAGFDRVYFRKSLT